MLFAITPNVVMNGLFYVTMLQLQQIGIYDIRAAKVLQCVS